jgi:hypothetical protein
MVMYRLCLLADEQSHKQEIMEFECLSDDEAMDRAGEIEHSFQKELWSDDRLVGSFPSKSGLEFTPRNSNDPSDGAGV